MRDMWGQSEAEQEWEQQERARQRAQPCATCEATPTRHGSGYNDGKRLCCRCYVTAGHPPADWHRLCMETYAALSVPPGSINT